MQPPGNTFFWADNCTPHHGRNCTHTALAQHTGINTPTLRERTLLNSAELNLNLNQFTKSYKSRLPSRSKLANCQTTSLSGQC